jgi:hypothetical protein
MRRDWWRRRRPESCEGVNRTWRSRYALLLVRAPVQLIFSVAFVEGPQLTLTTRWSTRCRSESTVVCLLPRSKLIFGTRHATVIFNPSLNPSTERERDLLPAARQSCTPVQRTRSTIIGGLLRQRGQAGVQGWATSPPGHNCRAYSARASTSIHAPSSKPLSRFTSRFSFDRLAKALHSSRKRSSGCWLIG